jgi:hypothetical protein
MSLGEFGSFSSPEIDRESDMLRENERLRSALEIAHGALLCIGGTDSNWSQYARNLADEIAPALQYAE